MNRPKLNVVEQVEYMRDKKGIRFEIYTETEAEHFLKYNTYFFKIKSYAKNFEKYTSGENKGRYINLDFAYLVELSEIDMSLRHLIIQITLDTEHFLKTQLMRDFQDNKSEDGYQIIKDFLNEHKNISGQLERTCNSATVIDLYKKHKNNFAIWNIIELLSFNNFLKLYSHYYNTYVTPSSLETLLWSVRHMRNAAAHNTCLLNNINKTNKTYFQPNIQILNMISKIPGIDRLSRKNQMHNPITHDFIVTLYVFLNSVTDPEIKTDRMDKLHDLFSNRMLINKDYFIKNQSLTSHYIFASKIIDYFYKEYII